MKRCKQLVFPAEIYIDKNKNVYTNEITSIFRGRLNKKDTVVSSKSNVVRSLDRLWNQFEPDLYRLQEKLERAGLALVNGEVTYIEENSNV